MGNPITHPDTLLQRDDVRTDLQLTDDQKAKLYDVTQGVQERVYEARRATRGDPDAQHAAFENIFKKVEEDVNAILTPGQKTRLREIAVQLAGFSSAAADDVQKKLSITDSQKAKITDLLQRQEKATRDLWTKLEDGEIQFQDVSDGLKKNQQILTEMIGKILTSKQKDQIKKLGGRKFVPTDPDSGF